MLNAFFAALALMAVKMAQYIIIGENIARLTQPTRKNARLISGVNTCVSCYGGGKFETPKSCDMRVIYSIQMIFSDFACCHDLLDFPIEKTCGF